MVSGGRAASFTPLSQHPRILPHALVSDRPRLVPGDWISLLVRSFGIVVRRFPLLATASALAQTTGSLLFLRLRPPRDPGSLPRMRQCNPAYQVRHSRTYGRRDVLKRMLQRV